MQLIEKKDTFMNCIVQNASSTLSFAGFADAVTFVDTEVIHLSINPETSATKLIQMRHILDDDEPQ